MNGFPESGFPVLADMEDRITLNTLYYNPIRHLGYKLDVVGNNRLLGALILGGGLSGVTTIAMGGAFSGATTIGASGNVTLSGGNLIMTTGNILMTSGEIGSILAKIKKAWLTNLHIQNRPTCGNEDEVALVSDLAAIKREILKLTPEPPLVAEYQDFIAGTAKDYVLLLSAIYPFSIDSFWAEVDDGTIDVSMKIGSTAITGIDGVTVDTSASQIDAIALNSVAVGDRVYLSISATYTGTPTLIRIQIKTTRL